MTKRPNIVFVMTDQQRLDSVGAYGSPYGATPNLDRLASSSVVFDRYYAACPLCVPTRCAIATGRFPHANGAIVNRNPNGGLGPAEKTLPECLDEAGYVQAHIGVHHISATPPLEERVPFERFVTRTDFNQYLAAKGLEPFDLSPYQTTVAEHTRDGIVHVPWFSGPWPGVYPYPREDFLDAFWAREAVAALKAMPTDRPYALYCYFWAPHSPFINPKPYDTMYDPEDIELPPNTMSPLHEPRHLNHLPGAVAALQPDLDGWRRSWAAYLGLVKLVDECLGEVLDAVESRVDSDDTIIVFSPDHGEQLGSQSLFQKMNMYQESIHLPMMISAPGNTGGRRNQLVSQVDLLPTLLDYAGIQPQEGIQGTSLRSIVEDATTPGPAHVYCEYNGNIAITFPQRAIITDRYKLILGEGPSYELYDLQSDPYELHNLADDPRYEGVRQDLTRHLVAWMKETKDDILPMPSVGD
jgi:arylsulfatase A-like enzyme